MPSPQSDQLTRLDTVIAAAYAARDAARRDMLFASREGLALVEAFDDLVDLGPLETVAADIRHELAPVRELVG